MKKRAVALGMALIIFFSLMPLSTIEAADLAETFVFLITYSDLQSNINQEDQRYGSNSNAVSWQLLQNTAYGRMAYMAQNEYEGFQLYYYEKGDSRNIRVEVDPYVNEFGEVLDSVVYKEEYFSADTVIDDKLADALIPYGNENIQTTAGQNLTFYVDLHSRTEQTPGIYTSQVRLYIEEELARTEKVAAKVWDFALPESHYTTLLAGLYNASSGYGSTRGFLEANGVRFDSNNDVVGEDIGLAEAILENWQEVMLAHGFTPYEIPRFLKDLDSRAALKTIADPRRKLFSVPLTNLDTYDGKLNIYVEDTLREFKSLTDTSFYLHNKAFFYPADEPAWETESEYEAFDNLTTAIGEIWPDYHAIVPYTNAGNYSLVVDMLKERTDIVCFNQERFRSDTVTEQILNDYLSDDWFMRIRTPGNIQFGSFRLYRWGKSPAGVFRRIFFWQQARLGDDGVLAWNCAFLPYVNGSLYDVWAENTLPPFTGVQGDNGDGLLLYPGVPLGLPAETPIMSLRFKQIASGIDDYDYLRLAEENLGHDKMVEFYSRVLGAQAEGTLNSIGSFVDWEYMTMNNARIDIGEALSGKVSHSFGDWEIVVEPSDDDEGIAIHTCATCGAVESAHISEGQLITYALSVDNGTGTGDYAAGIAVPIEAKETLNGKTFKQWEGADNVSFMKGDAASASAVIIMPEEDVELTAVYGEDLPVFEGKRLLLSGQLGVQFSLRLPENFDVGDSYVEFTVNGNKQTVYTKDLTPESNGKYYFTCYVSSIQMAETITAVFNWEGGDPVSDTYSVAEYLNYFDQHADEYSTELINLVHSIADYGHYAQICLSTLNNWTIGEKYAEMAACYTNSYDYESIKSAVSKYATVKNIADSGLTKITHRLRLESSTNLEVLFYTDSSSAVTATGKKNNDTLSAEKLSKGRYIMKFNDIPAYSLDQMYTVEGECDGDFSCKIAGLSYVYSFLNNASADDTMKNMLSALYNYHIACKEYVAAN